MHLVRAATILMALLAAVPASAAAPDAEVSAARSSCVAPCAIFFDARATTDADFGSSDWRNFVDLQYTWDFGDPESVDLNVEFLFRALSPAFLEGAGLSYLATAEFIPVYTIDSDETTLSIGG